MPWYTVGRLGGVTDVKRLLLSLFIFSMFFVHISTGQIIGEDPVVASLKKVVVEAQRKVKPMKGPEAYQCFTEDDKRRFDQNEDAERIAKSAVISADFEPAMRTLRRKSKDYQLKVLDSLRVLRDKTYAEAGRYGPDVQTDSGAEAQSEIASKIVEIMSSRLPCCNRH
jgi:hypothetical protein